jgi:CubicO group peptidase (beta-lactamase class C family)
MLENISPEDAGISRARLERISDWLSQQVSQERLSGCSALIGRRGGVAYFQSAGKADHELDKPFLRDTIVRIYSMTKPVTTVAAMMLYERGGFQLDDPVSKYLPEFTDTPVWTGSGIESVEPQKTPMLVRHLMTHTSGLTYGFMQTNAVDESYRKERIEFQGNRETLAETVGRLAEIPLICQPGSQWNYSVSTDVLGRLVEVWSGLTLEEFMVNEIFRPLRMRDTGFSLPVENVERFSALYSPLQGGGGMGSIGAIAQGEAEERKGLKLEESYNQSSYLKSSRNFSGGGGLVSTIDDYAQFCQMLMNGGELNGERLLGRKTVEHMRLNHLPGNNDMAAMGQPVWSETSYDGIGFGLGVAVVLDPVKASIVASVGEHHWGGAASTFFWLDPLEDLFVVFLTQLIPSSTYPIRRELRTRVYQALVD